MMAPESSEASSENAAVDARSAPVALRSTSSTKSMSGVSATRDESARHFTAVLPIGVVTHASVARCMESVAASTAALSPWPAHWITRDCLPTTSHRPDVCDSATCATATDCAQFFGCISRTPLIMVSAISWCECPYRMRSRPGTSCATRAATFSLGTPLLTVS